MVRQNKFAARMESGNLNKRFAFQPPVETINDYGTVEQGWGTAIERWTHIRFLRGGETVQAARLNGKQPVILTVRADPETKTFDTSWRAYDLEKPTIFYNVRSVIETEDRYWVEVMAERGVAV